MRTRRRARGWEYVELKASLSLNLPLSSWDESCWRPMSIIQLASKRSKLRSQATIQKDCSLKINCEFVTKVKANPSLTTSTS